jgi:hypothetical protein
VRKVSQHFLNTFDPKKVEKSLKKRLLSYLIRSILITMMMTIEAVNKAIARLSKPSSIRNKLYQLRNWTLDQSDYLPGHTMDDVIRHIDKLIAGTMW